MTLHLFPALAGMDGYMYNSKKCEMWNLVETCQEIFVDISMQVVCKTYKMHIMHIQEYSTGYMHLQNPTLSSIFVKF